MTIQTDAVVDSLNGHAHLRADPDPPRGKRGGQLHQRLGGAAGVVSLNMTDKEREALWSTFRDSQDPMSKVPRRALMHLLLDHAHLLAHLIKARTRIG